MTDVPQPVPENPEAPETAEAIPAMAEPVFPVEAPAPEVQAEVREICNEAVHSRCKNTVTIDTFIAWHQRTKPQFHNFPCHYCRGNFPVGEFTWKGGGKCTEKAEAGPVPLAPGAASAGEPAPSVEK